MILKQLQEIMPQYEVQKITQNNIKDVYQLIKNNTYFIKNTQNHEVNIEECIEDITILPPNKSIQDKTYVAIYDKTNCIALLDFIEGFPNKDIGFIGFFILSSDVHHKNIGTHIFNLIVQVSKELCFKKLELKCDKENKIGQYFWTKMGFKEIGRSNKIIDNEEHTMISMSSYL